MGGTESEEGKRTHRVPREELGAGSEEGKRTNGVPREELIRLWTPS